MTTALAIRRSTVLADARGGALSCLPHLSGSSPRTTDDRVERAAAQIAAVRVRVGEARVGEGVPGGVEAATAGAVYLVAAGAQGLFSYALFRGGGWVFQNKHPVWGVLFALGTMSSLWAAGNRLSGGK